MPAGGILVNHGSELIREPRLLVPKKIPLGPVKVDFTHPLAQGCHGFFLGRDAGKPYMPNLARPFGQELAARVSSIGTESPIRGYSEYGPIYDTSNDDTGSYIADLLDPWWRPSNAVTIAAMCKFNSHASSGTTPIIRGNTTAASRQYYTFKCYSGATSFVSCKDDLNNNSIGSDVGGLSLGDWHLLIGSVDTTPNNPTSRIYVDGTVNGEAATAQPLETANSPDNTHFRLGPGTLDDANRAFDGEIAFAAMWYDVGFTYQQMYAFAMDPYQFLVPA